MHEFDLIGQYFKPLAKGFPGSLGLTDDAAVISVPEGYELVVTKDAMSEGVHFIGNEDAALVARKLMRTNLSDLAAKGAKPLTYFLAVALPKSIDAAWVKRFAEGLAQDQEECSIHLGGGDTISTKGTLTLSMTAMGLVKKGTMLRRNGAREGDIIVVSGTLGDSAAGLLLLASPPAGGKLEGASHRNATLISEELIQRYLLPQPRMALGMSLVDRATSCMDISDGLVQDLGHICAASGVGAVIHVENLPLSEALRNTVSAEQAIEFALAGGDDYELLFTLPASLPPPQGCTAIGVIQAGSGVTVLSHHKPFVLNVAGYQHF